MDVTVADAPERSRFEAWLADGTLVGMAVYTAREDAIVFTHTEVPEQYEGQESDPLVFCTGPGPAQQVDPFIPWLMRKTGAKTFFLPSADYIWPRVLNARVREVVTAGGPELLGAVAALLDEHTENAQRVLVPEASRDLGLAKLQRRLHHAKRAQSLGFPRFERLDHD